MTCLLASVFTLAREAWDVLRPRTLDEVTARIWDRAYATMQASAVPSVPQSERAETATERPAPGHSPASGVTGVGHPSSDKRFAAADWLQTCLVNAGVETGAGWPLALVDGITERLDRVSGPGLITQTEATTQGKEPSVSIDNPSAPPLTVEFVDSYPYQIGGVAELFARTVMLASTLHDADRRGFEVDMAYLRAYSAAILEHAAPPQLGWTSDDTVEERLVDDMTGEARRAVFGAWPSFETLWAQA